MTTNQTNKTIIEKKSANNNGPQRNDKGQGLNDEGQGLFAHFPSRMIYIPSLVGLVGQEMVVAPSNSFYINFLALQPNFIKIGVFADLLILVDWPDRSKNCRSYLKS